MPIETTPAADQQPHSPTDATPEVADAPKPVDDKKVAKDLKSKAEASKRNRRTYQNEWKRNVELRIGHLATPVTHGIGVDDDIQTEVNPDWYLTKMKTANLFSQVPQVQGTHENKQYAKAVPPFMKSLNYEIGEKRANVFVPMNECLNDVVNASGIAAVMVGYAARFEAVDMPQEETIQGPQGPIATNSLPPEVLQGFVQAGLVHMVPTQRVISDKFFAARKSPSDLLWPVDFTGSNFDDGDWIGFTGKMSWPEAVNELKLTEDQKDKAVSGGDSSTTDTLRSDTEASSKSETQTVKYDELYYWRYKVDPEEKSFKAIWKIVFVHGIDEPVLHEAWKGQKYDEQTRKYVGACKFPVRILTLTYITDNPVPPSDSSAGRPQVNDMRRSRSQMFDNRERSIPIRGFNTNRVDPLIAESLMRGTWQGMIPFNGDATNSIWEVARASYPSEDMAFDQATQRDLERTWGEMGSTPGRKTKDEVNANQAAVSSRVGQDRAHVANFFLSIVEVLAGWMTLYSDFPSLTDQEKQEMHQAWDEKHILHDLVLKIRPDSTIVLDPQQRIDRLFKALNMTAKSGYVNVKPIIVEIIELSGIDPSEVVVDPQPQVEEPNISYRFSGKEDLTNVAVMAMLVKKKLEPTPEDIDTAKKIILALNEPPKPPAPPAGPGGPPGPGGPLPPGGPKPPAPPSGGIDAHPKWQMAGKIAKRSRDI